MEKVSKELHDKLFNLRMKLTFAKMNNEDVLELEKQIKQVRKEIALEAIVIIFNKSIRDILKYITISPLYI